MELIGDALLRVNKMTQKETLTTAQEKDAQDNIFCILDYNPLDPNVCSIVKHYWDIME